MGGRRFGLVLAAVLVVGACSGDDGASSDTDAPDTGVETTLDTAPDTTVDTEATTTSSAPPVTEAPATPADEETLAAIQAALDAGSAETCDPLDTARCYLPYPSNAATVEDPSSNTGRRVSFDSAGLPANTDGVHVDAAEWNRNDGFSPNSTLLTLVPGLDPVASELPPWTDLSLSLGEDATVLMVDLDTGERIPLWAEPDAKAESPDEQLLVIHPAISLPEGHSFAVGLRNLVGTDGEPIEAGAVFRAYRDALTTELEVIENRRPAMEAAIGALVEAGVQRDELVLAWDFTVASTENVSGRLLHIRDDALGVLGDESAPAFAVTEVIEAPEAGLGRVVKGTYTVPNYLTADGAPGNRFNYTADTASEPDSLPVQNGTVEAPFMCIVSEATMNGTEPARLAQYGHGLLGSETEVDAGNLNAFSNEHNIVFCATKWAGMSEDDIGNAITSLQEFSNFPTMADRMQQGALNQIFLGRLMTRADGLVSHPAFQRADATPMIDTSAYAYDGNSQGGIMGLMLTAVSPDFERAVLGVVGMNYSLLLPRSVDFDEYELVMVPAYPSALDRTFLVSFIQMLWDRGEGAGYVQHVVSDPYPGTPAKDVLLHVAFGDWQVTELSAYIAARTMGIPVHYPVVAEERTPDRDPAWGIDALEYPTDGSALVVWDSGSDPIPLANEPPRSSRDPHGDPRNDANVRVQKEAFMYDGELIDACDALACTAAMRE